MRCAVSRQQLDALRSEEGCRERREHSRSTRRAFLDGLYKKTRFPASDPAGTAGACTLDDTRTTTVPPDGLPDRRCATAEWKARMDAQRQRCVRLIYREPAPDRIDDLPTRSCQRPVPMRSATVAVIRSKHSPFQIADRIPKFSSCGFAHTLAGGLASEKILDHVYLTCGLLAAGLHVRQRQWIQKATCSSRRPGLVRPCWSNHQC